MSEEKPKGISDLFKDYDKANAEWQEAKRLVEEKYNQRSQVIKCIFVANDLKKNLKRRTSDGVIQQLTIVRRGESWFFRGEKYNEPIVWLS